MENILAPVIIVNDEQKKCVIVHLNVAQSTATVYYRPNIKYDNSKFPILS